MDRLESEQIALVLLTQRFCGYCGCFLICIIYCCKALLVTWWVTLSYLVQLCTVVSIRLEFGLESEQIALVLLTTILWLLWMLSHMHNILLQGLVGNMVGNLELPCPTLYCSKH